jgi:hypothetical protein
VLGRVHGVGVIESFGDEASNPDLTEVVEEGAYLVGGAVDLVGVTRARLSTCAPAVAGVAGDLNEPVLSVAGPDHATIISVVVGDMTLSSAIGDDP